MPSDTVTLMVTTGLGVSVVAGIISGVCYVLVQGYKNQRNRKPSSQWYCIVCNRHLRSIEGVLESDRIVECLKCTKKICKQRCSKYRPLDRGWICHLCRKQPPWYQNILNTIQPHPKLFHFIMDNRQKSNNDCINEIDEDLEVLRKKEKEQVRDFIERLVEAMLGDNVDDASVARLYNNKEYLPVSGESPCTAHAALKQLIEKVLYESLNLPKLNRQEAHPAIPEDNSRTYEDLLATAILNKVVENSQNTQPSSSSAASVSSSRLSSSSKYKNNKEYYFGDETLESKWKNADPETTSVSSLEEWLHHSDSSIGSTKYIDRVSLTIQQRIEEVSASSESDPDDDEYETTNSTSLLTNDDNNWYLQKRQFINGTHSPVPVPMLVPNPTSEAKVLIGDRSIDDTSDLSDAGSDYGDIEQVPGLNTLLIESKTVIGGKNLINITDNLTSNNNNNNNGSDGESSADSGVKEDVNHEDERNYDEEKPKTDMSLDDENIEDASILSVYSQTEKDTEYTEKYASLPRTIEKNLTELPESDDLDFAGNYSKKEKEKWRHPIEMKNNPYTKENIEKRMKSTAVGFGRDYYLRQASLPAGTRKKHELIHSPTTEPDCYRAIPTIIDDDSGIVQVDDYNNNNSNNNKNQESIEAITSDSDLSLVNCYDVENAKIYRKTSGGEHELRITVNTEGLLYKPINDEIDSIEMVSENPTVSIDIDHTEPPPNIEIHVNTEKTPEIIPRQFKAPIAQKRSKKSDNTLIRKIYSDPVVRSFVLVNREQIPIDDDDGVDEFRSEIMVSTPKIQQQKHNISIELSPINVEEFEKFDKSPTLDNFSLELSDNESALQRQNSIVQDPEITELKEKRLVANRLGEFSKSFPNLTKLHKTYVQEKCEETQCNGWKSNDLQQQSFVSVKDLKKKFESNEAIDKSKPVHSLTARSISKPIREKLRIEDNNRNYDKIVGSAEFRNVEEEEVIDANTNQ